MLTARRFPWSLALALFGLYATVAVNRHRSMQTSGFDLGIFTQAVRAYAEGRSPVAELKSPGFPLLGDHFHPILALLAPVYRLWPSPMALLVAQAALLALSAVPLTRLAIALCGRWPGYGLGVAYGLSWGIQGAVGFDFHEIAFAVPLLAFAMERLLTEHLTAAVAWTLPLLLVKEDQALTVAMIGAYVFWRGRRRLGLAVAALAVVWGAAMILLVIPAMNPFGVYEYTHSAMPTGDSPLTRLFLPSSKVELPLALLLPVGFLALRSPLVVLAVPTVLLRFWSANESYWGTGFHYSAVLMPVVFAAATDGLSRVDRAAVSRAVAAFAVCFALALTATGLPLRAAVEPEAWRVPAAVFAWRDVLRVIPDGAEVAASNRFAAELAARCRVYLFPTYPSALIRPEWVVAADPPGRSPIPAVEEIAALGGLPGAGYAEVAAVEGMRVFRLSAGSGRPG